MDDDLTLMPDVEALGVGLTACFRKGMDGPASVVLHNVSRIIPGDLWVRYVTVLRARCAEVGVFDAHTLRQQVPAAIDAILDERPQPRDAHLLHALSGGFDMLDLGDWVTLASHARMGLPGVGDDGGFGALASAALVDASGRMTVETSVKVGDVEVARVRRWPGPRTGGGATHTWGLDVVGGPANGQFATHDEAVAAAGKAIDVARVGALLAEVDEARAEAHRDRGLPYALDPADACDAAVAAAGAAGTLLYRKAFAGSRRDKAADTVEYLLATEDDGVVRLNGWRATPSPDGSAAGVSPSLRTICSCLAEELARHGRRVFAFDRDADATRGIVSGALVEGLVVFEVTIVREVRDEGGDKLARKPLASRRIEFRGRVASEADEPPPALPGAA